MKKIAAIALVLSMAMMTACGGSGNTANDQASSGNGEETKKVGLVCDVAGTQVFVLDMIDGLKASAEKHGFEVVIAECADAAAYEDNCRALVEEGVDLLIGGSWQAEMPSAKWPRNFRTAQITHLLTLKWMWTM